MPRNPVASGLSATYVRLQTELQTAFGGVAITDAIRVQSIDWSENVEVVKRTQNDSAHEGALRSLPGVRQTGATIVVEHKPPTTGGDKSTWQQRALWEACPVVIDDSTSVLRISQTAGRIPFVHYTPVEVATYYPSGQRKAAFNCALAFVSRKAEPGGIVLDTFELLGDYVAPVDATANDVAQVSTVTIDTAADGDWTVTVTDDLGARAVASYTASGDSASDIASALETPLDAMSFVGASAAGAVLTITGQPGRVLTIAVTTPAGGAATVAQSTAAVSFAERPSFQHDATPVVYFNATITHAVDSDAPLNVGSWELDTGMSVESKKTGDRAGGFSLPRVSKVEASMLTFEFDDTDITSFNAAGALANGSEVSWQFAQGAAKVICPQATYEKLDAGERAGTVSYKGSLHLHSSGTASDSWRIEI